MPLIRVPLSPQAYKALSVASSAQEMVNMYTIGEQAGSKYQSAVRTCEGYARAVTLPTGEQTRCLHRLNGQTLIAVAESRIYALDPELNATDIGWAPNIGRAFAAGDYRQCVIKFGNDLYYANATGSGPVSLPFVVGDLALFGSYIVVSEINGQKFYVSDPTNIPPSFDTNEFGVANAKGDYIVALASVGKYLWCLGEYSSQAFYESGNAFFPITPMPNTEQSVGIIGQNAKCIVDQVCCFVSDDLGVYMIDGLQMRRVSTEAIEKILNAERAPETIDGFGYKYYGHYFFCFALESTTVVYDASTGLWHERKIDTESIPKPWRIDTVQRFGTKVYGANLDGSQIYEIGYKHLLYDTDKIKKLVTTTVQHDSMRLFSTHKILIDMANGEGSVYSQTPKLMVDWSDDGGHTWSPEVWLNAGRVGEYFQRVELSRVGGGYQRIYRIKESTQTPITLFSMYADIEGGEA